ncbi:ComF family protein [Saccharopolyspora erythraea]|uniref:ComF family protein n=1 Tax=Saccharopolyspora erythraea TaxID=1836 RepID=UPI001BA6FE88|nr:ComF family protein [Saccharopolyspora erythraea]QUH04843.1 ComF family protein [Saccharopolyspora erythraea]
MATRLREALSSLADLLFPLHCAGCRRRGASLCDECARDLGGLQRQRRPLLPPAPPAYALGGYRGSTRRAVLAYKESGQRHLAAPFGERLATGLRGIAALHGWEPAHCLLIPAPSRPIASRRRGGAHMTRVAMHMAEAMSEPTGAPLAIAPHEVQPSRDHPRAKQQPNAHPPNAQSSDDRWSAEVVDCLVLRRGVRDSAGLDSAERVRNLTGGVLVRTGRLAPETLRDRGDGVRTVLVDDVMTSGATAASCLRALDSSGMAVDAVLALTATAGWDERVAPPAPGGARNTRRRALVPRV